MPTVRHGPGRPRKYDRPSRAVTVTLPEDVLARLSESDADLGRAIVRLAERSTRVRARRMRPAELASYGNHAVIIVNPITVLKRLAGVQLVPIGNGRALIALEEPGSIPQLELSLRDALDRSDVTARERPTLEAIADILRWARHARGVSLESRTIIVVEAKRRRRRA